MMGMSHRRHQHPSSRSQHTFVPRVDKLNEGRQGRHLQRPSFCAWRSEKRPVYHCSSRTLSPVYWLRWSGAATQPTVSSAGTSITEVGSLGTMRNHWRGSFSLVGSGSTLQAPGFPCFPLMSVLFS